MCAEIYRALWTNARSSRRCNQYLLVVLVLVLVWVRVGCADVTLSYPSSLTSLSFSLSVLLNAVSRYAQQSVGARRARSLLLLDLLQEQGEYRYRAATRTDRRAAHTYTHARSLNMLPWVKCSLHALVQLTCCVALTCLETWRSAFPLVNPRALQLRHWPNTELLSSSSCVLFTVYSLCMSVLRADITLQWLIAHAKSGGARNAAVGSGSGAH